MADAIVSVVVEKLADLIYKQAKEQVDPLTGIEREVCNLSSTLKKIQAVLDDAEQRKIKEKTVKAWLEDLEDVSYEIDDVLDEWNSIILKQEIEGTSTTDNASTSNHKKWVRVRSFFSICFCFKQVVVRRDIALKIKELSGKLDLIEKQKNQFSFIISSGAASNSQEWKRVQTTSFIDESEVFGLVSDQNTLLSQLLSESCQEKKNDTQVVAIIGAGGVGKTTLAQLAYNSDQVKCHFEKRGWVCVSDPFDEIRVAKEIVESLESTSPNLNQLDSLLQRISKITFGKRFLLVLDDVWTEDQTKWKPLKTSLKHGAPRSKILLTTRNERVARVAGATSMVHLGVLSDSESWSLFCQVAFPDRTEIECERLENIGREIVKKCKGLPLAIKTIGRLLRFKNTIDEWQNVRDSNMWEHEIAEVKLFPHLYLSYNDLPSPVRRCFSYCAVFSKDTVIKVDDLIRVWMAQGYLNPSGSEDEMEDKGKEYFVNLAMRSFFQDFEKDDFKESIVTCKMHDIVHDFAQFLTKRDCLIIEGEMKEIFCQNARHLTCLGSEEGGAAVTLSNCSMGQPRSFFARYVKLEFTSHLLNSLKLVKVLKLDHCGLREIPREIGNLIRLRYLSLSNNDLEELPTTIYDLYNLQTLDLQNCNRLQELPPEIEKVMKLRHHIHSVRNMKFPVGIGKLTCLQTLSYFSVQRECKFGYLKNLNQLRGSLEITVMDNLDDASDAKNADLKSKQHLTTLIFKFHDSVRVKEDVIEALDPPPNLQRLKMEFYRGNRLPTWMSSLNNLRDLTLKRWFGLASLPPLGILPSLETLQIEGFPQLKFVGIAFLGATESSLSPAAMGFPMLMKLQFLDCDEWEEWEDINPEEDDTAASLMPRLRELIIQACPMLKALPHSLLRKASSLECIELDKKKYNPSTILSTALTLEEIQANYQSPSTAEATALA